MATRFLYHAHAVGFAGRVRRPFTDLIESQAQSALSSGGGLGRARVENFSYRGVVRFDAAETLVSGSADEKFALRELEKERSQNAGSSQQKYSAKEAFDTITTSIIENLNILDIVTADRVVARMTSRHETGEEPVILPIGSHFEGLKIAGHPVFVDLNVPVYCKNQNYTRLCQDLRVVPNGEMIASPLVSELPKVPGLDISKNRIKIDHFGSIYLADYLITPKSRRLIMIRLELGSPFEASMNMCEIDGNGSEYPPQ